MSEHTPTPWTSRRAHRPVDGEFDYAISSVANPGTIAECFGRVAEDRVEDAAANAAFIVRAVNCHDDLVKALEAAADFIKDQDAGDPQEEKEALAAWIAARAALNRASS